MSKTEKILLAVTAVFFLLAVIFLPRTGGAARQEEETFTLPGPSPEADERDGGAVWITLARRIDLNSATAEELTALPGVGRTTAAAIVAYREEHGLFRSAEELLLVPGIGEATLDAILAAADGAG